MIIRLADLSMMMLVFISYGGDCQKQDIFVKITLKTKPLVTDPVILLAFSGAIVSCTPGFTLAQTPSSPTGQTRFLSPGIHFKFCCLS